MQLRSDQHHALLLRHLAAAIRASTPLAQVPKTLAHDPSLSTAQRLGYEALARRLGEGSPLGQALQTMTSFATPETAAWIDQADSSLDQATVLQAIASDLELQAHGRSRLRLTLIWPTFLAAAACMLFAVIAIFVAPALKDAFESFGVPLPGITQQVFSGEMDQWLFVGWQPGFLLGLLLLCVLLTYTRPEVNRPLVRAAYAAGLLRRTEQAAFTARILGLIGQIPANAAGPAMAHLAASGLIAPLRPAAQALGDALASGQPWGKALQTSKAIPLHYALHLELGEQTQDAQLVLNTLRQQAHDEWDDALARFERNMVTLVYLTIASLIALLTTAVYLPIFKMGQFV